MSRPTSAALRNIVQSSYNGRARVTLVPNTGQSNLFPQTLTPAGTRLTVLEGDVRMDSSAEIRSTIDVTVLARWGTIKPNGAELFVEYGVDIAGGQTEWTSLGYFRINRVTEIELNGPIRIEGADRMAQVKDTEAVYPWVAPVGTTHLDLFTSLMFGQNPSTWFHLNAGVFPNWSVNTAIVSDYTLASQAINTQIPLEKPFFDHMMEVASDAGKRIFFDYRGRLTIVNADVDLTVAPVAVIDAGPKGRLSGLRRQFTREGVYTSVRATGDQPTEGDPPWNYTTVEPNLQADFLTNQTKISDAGLSWFGPFGRILKKVASPLLTTGDACLAAARTWQKKVTGIPYSMSFDMIPDPTLEPLDVVTIRYPGPGPSNTPPKPGMGFDPREEIHVIDSLVFPLGGGDMSVTTRDTTTYTTADAIP